MQRKNTIVVTPEKNCPCLRSQASNNPPTSQESQTHLEAANKGYYIR